MTTCVPFAHLTSFGARDNKNQLTSSLWSEGVRAKGQVGVKQQFRYLALVVLTNVEGLGYRSGRSVHKLIQSSRHGLGLSKSCVLAVTTA